MTLKSLMSDVAALNAAGFSGLKLVFSDLAASIGLSATALGGFIAVAAGIAVAVAAIDYFTESFDEAAEKADKSRSAYEQTASEVESLESQLSEVKDRISELNSMDSLTITEEAELQKLQAENDQLERQLAIKQKLANYQQGVAAEDANHVLTKDLTWQTGDFLKDKNGYMMTDPNGMPIMEYMSGDIIDRATSKQEKLNEKKAEQVKLEEEIANMEPEYHKHFWQADTEYEKKTKQLENLKSDVSDLEKEVSEDVETINSNYSSLFSTDGSVLPGYEKAVKRIDDLFDAYNNVDLSEAEKKLNKINSFFDGSTGKNFIKENLLEAAKQAKLTADDIKRMGIAIDGVDASDIAKYFNDLAASADEAAEAITGVDGSIAGVKAAMDSKNKDQDWTDMADALSKAQELYKKGKVGTDDFQTAAQFITYGKINPDDYKYDADAYVEYWEKAQQKIKRYFDSDNPLQSVTNFADDLVKSGFATKDNGEFSWTKKFKNSAAAAKELGISVEATESLMHSLESYGAEFDDVVFSAEGLNRYKTALDGIHSVYKDMEDGQLKKHLGSLIENWDDEYQKYQDDMTELTEDQIVHIEFVYDLSTIQAQIDELTAKQSGQGGKNADTNAEVLAANQKYLTTAKQGLQVDNVSAEVQAKIKVNENTINDLYDQLSKEEYGSNKFIEIQAKIQNTQELQKSILNAFSETHPEINTDSSIEEVQSAWEDFFSKPQELHVNAELSTDEIQSQLEQLASGSSITFNADVDGDGIEDEVKALKNQDGTITYTAEIDGVQKKIEVLQGEDNTLTFNILAEDQATPVIEDVNKRELISKTCALYSEDYATQLIQLWNDASANPKFASLSAEDQATWVINTWNSLTPEQKEAYLNGEISITDTATGEIQTVENALNSLQPKLSPKANITATENATSVASSAASALNGVNGKTSNMYIYTHHIDTYSSTGKGKLLGTARYGGTARASGTLFDTSWLKDSWKTKVSEDALTGEKGQEIVVNGNQWWTVGDRGAEFAHIPEGSIVFDAEQSRQLLSSGKINSRGRSYLGGTAYASGWRLPSTSSGSSSKSSSKSSGKSSSSSNNYSSSSSGKSSGSSSKGSSSAASSSDKEKNKIDWIEVALQRLERTIKNLQRTAESAFKSFTTRNKALSKQISSVTSEIKTQEKAYKRYIKEANSVGLSSALRKKVQKGEINISEYDEDTRKKIDEYTKWYEAALKCKDSIADLKVNLVELKKQKFENLVKKWDNAVAKLSHNIERLQSLIDRRSSYASEYVSMDKSEQASKENIKGYQKIISETQKVITQKVKKLNDLRKNLDLLVENGDITKGSEDWYELQEEIWNTESEIDELNSNIIDASNNISAEYMKMFENVATEYENKLGLAEHLANHYSNVMSQAEAKGYLASKKYYEMLKAIEQDKISSLVSEKADLEKAMYNALASGEIEKGSQAYYDMRNQINSVSEALQEAELNMINFDNAMREAEWGHFDYLQEQISQLNKESDFLIDLMSSSKMYDDKGNITAEGQATLGLHGQNYNVLMSQADKYASEIEKINAEMANDPNNTKLIERKQQLIAAQWESVKAAEAEKQAIIDFVEEGIKVALDNLKNLISEYKNALDSQKEFHDFQKKIEEQTKNIVSLQKQLMAYQNDVSEETQAKIQKIKEQLEKAKDDLDETKYDKYISDQKKLLDDLYDEYEKALNERLDNTDYLIQEVIDSINANSGEIYDTLSNVASDVGVTLSEELQNIWDTSISGAIGETRDVLSMYSDNFSSTMTTLQSTVNGIQSAVDALVEAANAEAERAKAELEAEENRREEMEQDALDKAEDNKNNTKDDAEDATNNDKTEPPKTPPKYDSSIENAELEEVDKKKPTSSKPKTKNVKVGDVLTFKSGRYYEDSQGNGKSGNYYLGQKVKITHINSANWAKYPYAINSADGKMSLGWVSLDQLYLKGYKLKGYASGARSIPGDQDAWVNELGTEGILSKKQDGIITHLYKGDSVLTSEQMSRIYDLATNPQAFLGSMWNTMPKADGVNKSGNTIVQRFENITFEMPNVKNYNELITEMQRDKNFEKLMQSMTVDQTAGKSPNKKFSFKF